MSSGVSGPDDSSQSSQSDLPPQLETGIGKAYPAEKAPAIKKWFETMFPDMSEADMDKAVGMWMQNEMQYMQSFMSRLQAQEEKANERLKKSIKGQ